MQLPFDELAEATCHWVDAYLYLIERGYAAKHVAFAMLRATINVYQALGMAPELPNILRSMAELVERGDELSS